MKNMNLSEKVDGLPNANQVCDMVMHLETPIHLMAWLMAETALRLSDIQALRVNSFSRGRNELSVGQVDASFRVLLSTGLSEALGNYVSDLRLVFEQKKRWGSDSARNRKREIPMFGEQALFPSWSQAGHEKDIMTDVISSANFVRALQSAAMTCGYEGRIHSHTLRHACATRWLEQGLTVAEIHHKLGHRDLLTTLMLVQALQFGGLTYTSETVADQPMKMAC
jgi:integrase